MGKAIKVQVRDKGTIIRRRKKAIEKKSFLPKAKVEICADDGKYYIADVFRLARRFHFCNVTEIKRNRGTRRNINVDYNHISCTLNSKNHSNIKLFGAEVSIRDYNERKLINGKIVSVRPYIIGTPPGEKPLPPIDE